MSRFVALMLSLFTKKTPAQVAMRNAREMIREARECKALGYHCAAKAAVVSALAYRSAAHAHRAYGE